MVDVIFVEFLCSDGVDLLVNQPLLRNDCFVSMEAVKWLQEKLLDCPSRRQVVGMMQVRVTT